MRPAAALSGTVSIPATGTTRSASRASAASVRISLPPAAKQSSLSCAMALRLAWLAPQKAAMGDDEIGDRRHVVEIEQRHGEAGQLRVARHRDDMRSEEHTSELQSLMRN